jgi:hypothetical protein
MSRGQHIVDLIRVLRPGSDGNMRDIASAISEMKRTLPPVAITARARILLEEIQKGNINSGRPGSLQVHATMQDLEKLVDMSQPQRTNTAIYHYDFPDFAGIFSDSMEMTVDVSSLNMTDPEEVYNFLSAHYANFSQVRKSQIAELLPSAVNIAVRLKLKEAGKPLE